MYISKETMEIFDRIVGETEMWLKENPNYLKGRPQPAVIASILQGAAIQQLAEKFLDGNYTRASTVLASAALRIATDEMKKGA